jgi:hypothetical protein
MNFGDAVKTLRDPDAKITREEAHEIIRLLRQRVIDNDNALTEKIVGAHSFYEGEYNMLDITETILNKLILDERKE